MNCLSIKQQLVAKCSSSRHVIKPSTGGRLVELATIYVTAHEERVITA